MGRTHGQLFCTSDLLLPSSTAYPTDFHWLCCKGPTSYDPIQGKKLEKYLVSSVDLPSATHRSAGVEVSRYEQETLVSCILHWFIQKVFEFVMCGTSWSVHTVAYLQLRQIRYFVNKDVPASPNDCTFSRHAIDVRVMPGQDGYEGSWSVCFKSSGADSQWWRLSCRSLISSCSPFSSYTATLKVSLYARQLKLPVECLLVPSSFTQIMHFESLVHTKCICQIPSWCSSSTSRHLAVTDQVTESPTSSTFS